MNKIKNGLKNRDKFFESISLKNKMFLNFLQATPDKMLFKALG